ncbi:MAG: U32 family peptidase [Methanoregula sp.]|nr:MAG: U32 family peptidase [Methanoregula sp.]
MLHTAFKQKDKKIPELLAPAGSPEAFRAAISAGADAVYLSGKQFGARMYARNFTGDEIEKSVAYAHVRGARVYVTVNTLVHDRELAGVGEYLVWLYSTGVDAVLVQDIGVAALAASIVPGLPLHASTQMTIHNAEGVRWAKDHGFSRVVLARELSLEETEEIARDTEGTGVGLEIFAHGALCYSYSGQCLLSSLIGGRSGNRGMCAQPCRKPYALVSGTPDRYGRPVSLRELPVAGRYLLSPKDLCTYPGLKRIVRSNVISLKIEGRMRSPEYVAIVVSAYRRALDALAQGDFKPDESDERDLTLAFNRGFTTGYLFGQRHSSLMGREQPDNRGLLVGTVTGYNTRTREVTVQKTIDIGLSAGDGVVFRFLESPGDDLGFSLNTMPVEEKGTVRFIVPGPVKNGALVFLTSSVALAARARRIINTSPSVFPRPVPVDLDVQVDKDGMVMLDGRIDMGNEKKVPVSLIPTVRLTPARTRPLTGEQFESQMRKTGGTPFAVRRFSLGYDGGMFAPVAELNRMRREFLVKALDALVRASQPPDTKIRQAQSRLKALEGRFSTDGSHLIHHVPGLPEISVYADSIAVAGAAAAAGCDTIIFEPGFYDPTRELCRRDPPQSLKEQVHAVLSVCRDAKIPLVLKLQKITGRSELDRVRALLPSLRGSGLMAVMVDSTGAAAAIRDMVPEMQLAGSAGLNVFNHLTVKSLSPWFFRLTLSPELSGDEIRDLVSLARREGCTARFELIVQGNAEAIVSADCLLQPHIRCTAGKGDCQGPGTFFGIRDNTGRIFPVRTDGACRTHVFNAVETCLLDYIPSLVQAGVGAIAIDARGRTPDYAGQMVRIYREAIGIKSLDITVARKRLIYLKEEAKRIAMGGITAGHIVRGLAES